MKQSSPTSATTAVSDGAGGPSTNFTQQSQRSRAHSCRTRQSSTSTGQRSSADSHDVGKANRGRAGDRNNNNGSGQPRRRASGGGGGGDSSSSDEEDSNRDADENRDQRSRSIRRQSSDDDAAHPTHTVSSSSQSRWVRPDRFDGTTSLETFLVKFENCASFNRWTEKEKLAHLWTSLQKEAAQLLWDAQGLSYDELVNRLRKRFGSCLLYTSPSPRDRQKSRMPSSA